MQILNHMASLFVFHVLQPKHSTFVSIFQDKKISHILSVDEKPLPDTLTQRYTYKHVYALDMYEFDLLSCFPECFGFIDQAIEGHCNVLVHW